MDARLAMVLASEGSSHYAEIMLILATFALTVITGALTWVTYLVHRDSVRELGNDNDNMHDVAVKEIDSNNRHLAAIRELNRISKRNRRGVNY